MLSKAASLACLVGISAKILVMKDKNNNDHVHKNLNYPKVNLGLSVVLLLAYYYEK